MEINVIRLLRLQHRLRMFISKRKNKFLLRHSNIIFTTIQRFTQLGVPMLFTCYLKEDKYFHFL